MALSNNSAATKVFLNIIGGKICRKTTKENPDAASRTNKNGELIYELQYNSLKAKVKDLNITEKEFKGEKTLNWEIVLSDVGEEYILQLPISGRVTNGFLFRLPNVNLGEEIEIVTFLDKEKTDRTVLIVKQNGTTVKTAYTKDAPNGLPPLKSVMFKGKEQWDDTEQQFFIKEMVERTIKPKLKSLAPAAFASGVGASNEPPQADSNHDESSDLPF